MANTAVLSNLSNGAVNSPAPQPTAQIYAPPSQTPQQVIDRSVQASTSTGVNEFLSERPKYYFQINISEYHRFSGGGNLFQVARTETTGSYIFPLPMSLIDIHAIAYDTVSLGFVTGSLIHGAAQLENNVTPQSIGAGLGGAAVAGVTNAFAGSRVGQPLVQAGVNMAGLAGYTPNSFLTILLKGPQYKRHTFRWKVSPRNEGESMRLRQIIQDLNNAAAPGTKFGGSIFTFPKIFTCSFMPNSKYLFKMKPAVLESIALDYSAGGAPAFMRGMYRDNNLNAPAVIEFEMNFLELEFWLGDSGDNAPDFNDSNDPTSVGDHSSLNSTGVLDAITGSLAPSGTNSDGSPTSFGNVIQNGQVPGG